MEQLKPKKHKWTPKEDKCLIAAVKKLGTRSWKAIATYVPERTGKQCRERWLGQLSPNVVKDHWTMDEDFTLIRAQKFHGNRWSLIANMLPGRSPISIKNRWSWLTRHSMTDAVTSIPEVKENYVTPVKKVEEPKKQAFKYLSPIEISNSSIFDDNFFKFVESLKV